MHSNECLQDGAPKIDKLPYKWLISPVYGRNNELANGVYDANINEHYSLLTIINYH